MQINAYLDLRISGDNLCFEKITKNLNITPNYINRKGDVHKNKYRDKCFESICSEDSWLVGYKIPEKQSFEDAVVEFTKPFLIHKDFITELSQKNTVTLWASLYPEENQMNINLSKKILSILHELNIEMDITYLYLVDFYEGRY